MTNKLLSELYKGEYDNETSYTIGDIVTYQGSSYVCIQNSTGNIPTNTEYWGKLAEKGVQGEQGPQGEKGDKGDKGLNWKGAWNSSTEYAVDDAVEHNGSSYICIQANTTQEPPNATYWELLAQKGVDGEGSGDVIGPSSAVNGNFVAFDGSTGKLIEDSGYSADDFASKPHGNEAHSVNFAEEDKIKGINEQTETSYTLVLADAGKAVRLTNSSNITLTVPTNSSVEFPIRTKIAIIQGGSGQVTISPDSGVTLESYNNAYKLTGQYAGAVLIKRDTDTWILEGDLTS